MALIIFDHFTVIFIIKIGLVAYSYSSPKQVLDTETTTETFFGHPSSTEPQVSESIFTSHSVPTFKAHQSAAENDQTSKYMTPSTIIVTPAKRAPKPAVFHVGRFSVAGGIGNQSVTNITMEDKLDTDDAFIEQVTPFSSSSSYTIQSSTYRVCTSFELDWINNVQYCTDAFGNTYILSSPSPINEQSYDEIYIQHDSNDTIRLDQLLETFCPNSVYCPEESKPVTLSNHCCIPCDCSSTCIDSGTCCLYKDHTKTEPKFTTTKNQYDIDDENKARLYENRTKTDELAESILSNSTVTSKKETNIYENFTEGKNKLHETCIETFVGNDSVDIEIKSTHSYMLIQSCPEDSDIDIGTRDKCIQSTETDMSDSVPFYSSRTKNNYRNIHCAKCNNDSLLGKQWDSYYTCPSEISTLPLSRSIETVNDISSILKRMDKCMVFWEPVTNTERYCVNQDRLISTCEKKGLSSRCLQYYAPVRGRKGVYRNLHCLFCNEESIKLVCDNKQNGADLFVMKLPIGDLFLKAETDEGFFQSETEVDEECEIGYVYDRVLVSNS